MPTWLGGWEWVILAVIALVVFGGSRLANAGKNAGKAIREFKEETAGLKEVGKAQPPAATGTTAPIAEDLRRVDEADKRVN